ncbi:oligoendopeptidase F [Schleiferilactobacillus perolens DSM 12744]|uniref:Oligopeptidase F n=1 Tax=Schleiferilactobacillus perolens DSM 12744 TaxID=1423792 RepID=A0A0R1MQ37_9LACO|nr:oligoendopeptidase F [Schleiferilactobacillus perolens DSM 12744]
MSQITKQPTRDQVPEELTWDLTKIFATDADWEKAFAQVKADSAALKQYAGTLKGSGTALLQGIQAVLSVLRVFEKVYVYASMKSDQDTANAHYQSYDAQVSALAATISADTAFMEPEILAIPADKLTQFFQDEPKLADYRHFIDAITVNRDHVLSADQEELLAGAQDAFSSSAQTFNVLNNSDLKFPTTTDEDGNQVQITNGVYSTLLQSSKQSVRKQVFKGLYSAYGQYQHTFASTLAGEIKVHNYSAKVRHYSSAREAALAQNHIPVSVYDTLIKEVNAHLPLLHRYVALRKRLLKLDVVHMYDMYTPITGTPQLSYTFAEAKKEARQALSVLGDDYLSHVDEIFNNRYIDVVENKGKRSGAYSGGAYDTPPYELLNWQNDLENLYTLVHETGHSVHSWYTRHNQPYQYGDYPIFVAEIASTTNENILTNYLLKTQQDPAVRAYVLNHYLDGFKGTIFRQTQFAEFEQFIHDSQQNGQPLTADHMSQFYGDLNARYYGPDAARDPEIAIEWTRIPHFYYNYYVYQYATGFAAAATLAEKISSGQDGAVDAYINNFLKSGSSRYAIDTMQRAGVDMAKKDYLENAFAVFEKRLAELEKLV